MAETVSNHPPSATLIAGKYQLIKMIGKGGMGSVWEGRHTSLGTRVAIKFIETEFANSAEARARFDNEAKAAATIQSKHAIQIYDHGVTDDGKPYIVMELLVGEPLDKRIERLGRMSLQDVARIFQQVARGLGRAHERGIIHRDLKPENIFLVLTPDDDDEVAKVLDFGIAKIKGTAGQQLSNSTKTGAVLGTPYFMSPEQARGMRDIDHRTDLWSLGVIVFKCVTGVLPFDGESLGDLLVKICTTQIPVPSQVLPGLPHAFDAWFARALERDPQKRFASALEMSDALSYACGVSVRRPMQQQVPADSALGNARTMATPSPMNSPFPQGGMYTPNSAANSGSQHPPPNQAMSASGSRMASAPHASSSGNYAPVPTPYGGIPQRVSNPNATPAQAAFGTQSPLTASTQQVVEKPKSTLPTILVTIAACLVIGGVGTYAATHMHGSSAAGSTPVTTTTAPTSVKVDATGVTVDVGTATTAIAKPTAAPTDTASVKIPDINVASNADPKNAGHAQGNGNHPSGNKPPSGDKPPPGGNHAQRPPGTGGVTPPPAGNGNADQSGF